MRTRQLLARGLSDQLADAAESSRASCGSIAKPERGGVGDRVPHAAVGDVDDERPEPGDLERGVELRDERRDVRQLDALDATVAAGRPHLDGPGRRLEPQHRLGLVISTKPPSSSTVATQIVFEPDIAGYSVGSMMM